MKSDTAVWRRAYPAKDFPYWRDFPRIPSFALNGARSAIPTASGTASSSAHSDQTLVSGVTLPVLPTAENKTTAAAVEIIWLAIEYNGGD